MSWVAIGFIAWDITLHLAPRFNSHLHYDLFWTAFYTTVIGLLLLDKALKKGRL